MHDLDDGFGVDGHTVNGCVFDFEFCANFIRNTANYSPPTSDLAADANTTVLWSMHKMNIGHDSSGNGFDGTTPATLTTFDSAVAGEW